MVFMLSNAIRPGGLAEVNVLNGTVAHNLYPYPLFHIFGQSFYFTNHVLMLLLSAGLMLAIFPTMARRMKTKPVPTGFRNFFESLLVFLQRDTFEPMLGKWAATFTPYLWTAFFFILFADLFGMLPVDELIQLFNSAFGTHIPEFWGGATGDLSVTATLAVCTFFTVHVSGLAEFIRTARRHHTPHIRTGHAATDTASDHPTADVASTRPWPVAAVVGVAKYLKHIVPPKENIMLTRTATTSGPDIITANNRIHSASGFTNVPSSSSTNISGQITHGTPGGTICLRYFATPTTAATGQGRVDATSAVG